MLKAIKVKEWFEAKEQEKAKKYNIYFQIAERNEDGTLDEVEKYLLEYAE